MQVGGDGPASRAARRQGQAEDPNTRGFDRQNERLHCGLVASTRASHKRLVSAPLFDHRLRNLRRDRAARIGTEFVLYDRAFDDCLERLADIRAEFSDLLLVGCPNPEWPERLDGKRVTVVDPGGLFADRAGGRCADLEFLPFEANSFNLVLCIGVLDTANNLPLAAAALELVLKPGGLLIGAIAGGQSLPRLRQAMLAADLVTGQASPHVHPRIEGPSLANLLTAAGFVMPVVDVDRVELVYDSLDSMVRDLRAMGATNVLSARSRRPLGRAALRAADAAFLDGGDRVTEQLRNPAFRGLEGKLIS